jgi:hypothetical protein
MKSFPNLSFVELMADRLKDNEHRGSWEDWHPERDDLFECILRNLSDLSTAVRNRESEQVSKSAADLANFAMKCAEEFGS